MEAGTAASRVTPTFFVSGSAGRKRALYSLKKAPYFRKRASKRTLHTRQKAHSINTQYRRLTHPSFWEVQVVKEPYIPAKEHHIPAKELAKEPHIPTIDPTV